MISGHLHSLLLQLTAVNSASIPALRGDQIHALFLDLVRLTDVELASRLHDEPDYRPFTVSLLRGAAIRNGYSVIRAGQSYWLRITLLDGGALWRRLSEHFLVSGNLL